MRIFAFVNGYGWNGTRDGQKGQPTPDPAQPTPGVFNETTLQRFDFVMDQLAQVGMREYNALIADCVWKIMKCSRSYHWTAEQRACTCRSHHSWLAPLQWMRNSDRPAHAPHILVALARAAHMCSVFRNSMYSESTTRLGRIQHLGFACDGSCIVGGPRSTAQNLRLQQGVTTHTSRLPLLRNFSGCLKSSAFGVAQTGIRAILVMVNFYHNAGGIEWCAPPPPPPPPTHVHARTYALHSGFFLQR